MATPEKTLADPPELCEQTTDAKELPEMKSSASHALNLDPPRAELEWTDGGVLEIKAKGNWGRIYSGSGNRKVADGLLGQVGILGSNKKQVDAEATNFVLAFLDSMQPRDAAEALLMTQMASLHMATMMLAKRLNHVENLPQQDSAERALNKLARTFAGHMEALKRYRTSGQQKVTVEHVTVNAGGQAIVGAVETGGGGRT